MKNILFITMVLGFAYAKAQPFISDSEVSDKIIKSDGELKLLYFTASWCGPCKMMAPVIEELDKDPKLNLAVYKVDIDKNAADDILGVTSVPTYLFVKDGKILGEERGYRNKDQFMGLYENFESKTSKKAFVFNFQKSQYTLVAGAHPTLNLKNLNRIWYNPNNLLTLSNQIAEKLTDPKDLQCGLVLAQRVYELDKSPMALLAQAQIQNKLANKKEAIALTNRAQSELKKAGRSTDEADALLKALKAS